MNRNQSYIFATVPPRDLLRWIFLGTGLFLTFFDRFVVDSVLRVPFWANLLKPGNQEFVAIARAVVVLAGLIPTGLLCLTTSWGMRRGRRWSRWTGIVSSGLLLLGFPWLTLLGAFEFYVLLKAPERFGPPAIQKSKDRWNAQHVSFLQIVLAMILFSATSMGFGYFAIYADERGLKPWYPGIWWYVYLLAFVSVNTTVHELGHALAAWLVRFELRAISIGPLTIWRGPYGFQYKLEWSKILEMGGYVGAAPTTEEGLRGKQLALIAAGPLASFAFGLASLGVFYLLPGSEWQHFWWIPAFNAQIAFFAVASSLLPIGYSDGSMLFHLGFETAAGRLLKDRLMVTKLRMDAEAYHQRAEFFRWADLQERVLAMSQKGGAENAIAIAVGHAQLGHAKLSIQDWPGAAREFRECLKLEAECALEPALAINSKALLHKACVERYDIVESGSRYAAALEVLEAAKKDRRRVDLAVIHTMLAQLHSRAGHSTEALAEADAGLRVLSSVGGPVNLRVGLYALQCECHLRLGLEGAARAALELALGLLRGLSPGRGLQNLAWGELAELGVSHWKEGASGQALELLQEAITAFESCGARDVGTMYRIKLSAVLRQLGRLEEAAQWMPEEREMQPVLERQFLEERVRFRLAAGESAVADCLLLLNLWDSEPDAAPEKAVAESLLAQALLGAGDQEQAELVARQAAEVLTPWRHPEAGACLITVALASAKSAEDLNEQKIEEALQTITSHPMLSDAEKQRLTKAERQRIERYFAREAAGVAG